MNYKHNKRPLLEVLSWVSGIIAALAAIVGLIVSFLPPREVKPAEVAGGLGAGKPRINQIDGPSSTPSSSFELDDNDLRGPWDQEEAVRIVHSYLNTVDWSGLEGFCGFPPCNPMHTLIAEYHLRQQKGEAIVLSFGSIEKEDDCRACPHYLSFFEFQKRLRGWKLTHSDVAVTTCGSWGKISSSQVNVVSISESLFGAFLRDSASGQGRTYYVFRVLGRVDGSLREVLNLQVGEDDSGVSESNTAWSARVSLLKTTSNNFFDLLVEPQGTLNGAWFQESHIFRFNGQKYIGEKL